MIKETVKSVIRLCLGAISRQTTTILAGPMRGRKLLRQHGLSQLSMLFGTYEPTFAQAFSSRIGDASVIYDVGANYGYFSLFAADQSRPNSRVYAFEPFPEILKDFCTMVEANRLGDRIIGHQVALAESTGTAKMYTPNSDKTGVLESALRGQRVEEGTDTNVNTVTLDDFVFSQDNPRPDVIKIDVEGGEASVLAGAHRVLAECRPVILLEVHGYQPAEEIWELTLPHGYRVWLLTDKGDVEVRDRENWLNYFAGSKWIIQHCVLEPYPSAAAAA